MQQHKKNTTEAPPLAPDVQALKQSLGPGAGWSYAEIDNQDAARRAAARWARLAEPGARASREQVDGQDPA